MVKEFLLLLESEKEKIFEVLRPQIHTDILKYLSGGFFDESEKRFVAFALMPVDKDYFLEYDYLLDFSGGHSAVLFGKPAEKQASMEIVEQQVPVAIYPPSQKSLKEQIEEGFYHRNLVSFYGEYDFNEWNILTSSCFSNSKNKDQIFESRLRKLKDNIKNYFFNDSIFEGTADYYEKLHSNFRKRLEQRGDVPFANREIALKIPTDAKPYIGHSHLVALIRQRKKGQINLAYISYCQKAIFEPLTVKLKTFYPNEYHDIKPFFHHPSSMLFPDHKRYCLFIFFAVNSVKKSILKFFFYCQENNQVYEWTYFPSSTKASFFSIPKIFESISQLDSPDYFNNPECTLDDDDFWNNYVLVKDNGNYVYLKDIIFP